MSTLPRGGISQSPIHAVLQWIWDQSRSNTLAQLQSCAEKEVESIARDNGISASDFRALVSLGPNASDHAEWRYWTSTQLRFPRLHLKPSAICSEFAPSVRAIGAVDETLGATPLSQNGRIIAQTSKH